MASSGRAIRHRGSNPGVASGATVVPGEAVQAGQQGQFIYVVKPDNTVEIRIRDRGPGVRQVAGHRQRHRPRRNRGHRRPIAALPRRRREAGGPGESEPGGQIMNLSRIFIERPVMTVLISFAILLFGAIAFRELGGGAAKRGLPHHSGCWRRCRARTRRPWRPPWHAARTRVLHHRRHSIMNSTNSLGATAITVQFTLDRKIDAAAQDVQAAISRAGGRLPPSMPRPPSYQKVNPAEQRCSTWRSIPARCPCTPSTNMRTPCLAQRISMVSGVSRVQVFGRRNTPCACRWTRTNWPCIPRHRRSAAGRRRQQYQPSHRPPGRR